MIKAALSVTCGADTLSPPGPVVSGIVMGDLTGHLHPQTWAGLIDTGADRTVVPLAICRDLALSPRDMRSPHGFDPDAPSKKVPRYYLCIRVPGVQALSLLVYATNRRTVLLGRDFLAKLVFILDSPSARFAIGEPGYLNSFLLRTLALR
jgi:hypothetical protein